MLVQSSKAAKSHTNSIESLEKSPKLKREDSLEDHMGEMFMTQPRRNVKLDEIKSMLSVKKPTPLNLERTTKSKMQSHRNVYSSMNPLSERSNLNMAKRNFSPIEDHRHAEQNKMIINMSLNENSKMVQNNFSTSKFEQNSEMQKMKLKRLNNYFHLNPSSFALKKKKELEQQNPLQAFINQ